MLQYDLDGSGYLDRSEFEKLVGREGAAGDMAGKGKGSNGVTR
jgi:hypothetical protein